MGSSKCALVQASSGLLRSALRRPSAPSASMRGTGAGGRNPGTVWVAAIVILPVGTNLLRGSDDVIGLLRSARKAKSAARTEGSAGAEFASPAALEGGAAICILSPGVVALLVPAQVAVSAGVG